MDRSPTAFARADETRPTRRRPTARAPWHGVKKAWVASVLAHAALFAVLWGAAAKAAPSREAPLELAWTVAEAPVEESLEAPLPDPN